MDIDNTTKVVAGVTGGGAITLWWFKHSVTRILNSIDEHFKKSEKLWAENSKEMEAQRTRLTLLESSSVKAIDEKLNMLLATTAKLQTDINFAHQRIRYIEPKFARKDLEQGDRDVSKG